MNPKLPKPLHDALARRQAPGGHPPPELLSAFAEQALAVGEKQRVTEHLAQCSQCREVVFLASSAAEEPLVEQEQDVAQDKAGWQVLPVFAAKPEEVAASGQLRTVMRAESKPTASKPEPRRKWALRLVWAVPVAAVVLLVAGVVVQRQWQRPAALSSTTVASNTPTVAQSAPNDQMTAELKSPAAKSAGAPEAPPKAVSPAGEKAAKPSAQKAAGAAIGGAAADSETQMAQKARRAALAKLEASQTSSAMLAGHYETEVAAAPSPAPVTAGAASDAAASNRAARAAKDETGQPVMARAQPKFEKPTLVTRGPGAEPRQWRISDEGYLEYRATSPEAAAESQRGVQGGWTRVLAGDQPPRFRVVAVIGEHVWAGGLDGALFHSADGGQQWSKALLESTKGREKSIIVSIRFDDPQHGVVVTNTGARWSTSDGGVSWSLQP